MKWSDAGPNPALDQDFFIDFTDAANPNLRLAEGSLTWEVWSKSGSNPGNLGTLTTEDSENYAVRIANGANPGAVDFKGGVLDPAGNNYSSIVAGSRITGNLTGNLQVVASGGSGGAVSLTIDGDAIGNITAPIVSSLSIGGDLSGDVNITDELTGALDVGGDVAETSLIEINVLGPDAYLFFSGAAFDGDLVLQSDIPSLGMVDFTGVLGALSVIDLTGHDVWGELNFMEGGSGNIVDGGVISGTVLLAGRDPRRRQ